MSGGRLANGRHAGENSANNPLMRECAQYVAEDWAASTTTTHDKFRRYTCNSHSLAFARLKNDIKSVLFPLCGAARERVHKIPFLAAPQCRMQTDVDAPCRINIYFSFLFLAHVNRHARSQVYFCIDTYAVSKSSLLGDIVSAAWWSHIGSMRSECKTHLKLSWLIAPPSSSSLLPASPTTAAPNNEMQVFFVSKFHVR